MRETYRVLPVWAGDVSGIAGALYEFGGMTVIHDPSGCSSTYNTHDELRWYREPSNIFISGLNMKDAVLGNDERFIRDILDAREGLPSRPEFIALCNSPVPWLNGTDFEAIAGILERKSGIPSFYVPSNGCHDYARGAGLAWQKLLQKFVGNRKTAALEDENRESTEQAAEKGGGREAENDDAVSVNVIGMMPLDFAAEGSVLSLEGLLQKNGFRIRTCLALGDAAGLRCLPDCTRADVSLVLSKAGLLPAMYLRDRYHIPFVTGVPLDDEDDPVLKRLGGMRHESALGETERTEVSRDPRPPVIFLTEPVLGASLASLVRRRTGRKTIVIDPLEADPHIRIPGVDSGLFGEEETETFLAQFPDADLVCDPMYDTILPDPERTRRIFLPTLALSGRIYREHYVNYFERGISGRLLGALTSG